MINEPFNFSIDSMITMLPKGYDRKLITGVRQELPAGSINLGTTSTDGEEYVQTVTTEQVKVHQRNRPVRTFVTDNLKSLGCSFSENWKPVRELYHGGEEDADGTMVISGDKVIERDFVYDSTDDSDGYSNDIRLVFRATVTPNGSIVYAHSTLIAYPVLFTIIGDVIRLTGASTVTPGNPGDGGGDGGGEDGGEYPSVPGLDATFDGAEQTVQIRWSQPNVAGYVSEYTVNLVNTETNEQEETTTSNMYADFPVTEGIFYTATVSYTFAGAQRGHATIPFTASFD